MMKTRKIRGGNKSVRRKWLLSYILVMVIPIACSILAYFACYSLISKEITAANSLSLVSAQSAIDSRFVKMQETALAVLRDQSFRDFALIRNKPQERYWKLSNVMEQLVNHRGSSLNIDIFIYFPELDYVITPDVANTLDFLSLSLRYSKNTRLTAEEWRSHILSITPNDFTVSSKLAYNRYGTDALVFCSNLSSLYQPGCYEAKIFISLQPEEVLPDIALHDESAFFILDPRGKVLYTEDPALGVSRLALAAGKDRYRVLTIDGKKYACMFSDSGVADFIYAVATPYSHFWSRSYFITTIMFIGFVVASLIGVAVSVRLLFINYSPLRMTLESLPDEIEEDKNEFEHISEQLTMLYNAQTTMHQSLTRQQHYIKEYYLGMLLQGNASSLSDDDIIESLELDLSGKSLVPVFISVENEDSWPVMQSVYKETNDGRKSVSLSTAVENVLRERLPAGTDTLKTRSEDMIIIVCIASPQPEVNLTEDIENACEASFKYFEDNLNMKLQAVIGAETRDMDELPVIYRQVFPLRSFHAASSQGGRVMRAAPYIIQSNPLINRTESFLSLLYDAARSHSFADAREILRILYREFEASGEPATVKRYVILELTNRLYTALNRSDSLTAEKNTLLHCMEAITGVEAPEELWKMFEDFIRLLCAPWEDTAENTGKHPGKDKLHLRVQAYVRENYADCNLSLSQIAQSVGMSPPYVSKLYKLETGQGLLDFINTVRVDRAKRILTEEQTAINELASRVGYTNVKTFRRAFQKVTGANPGTYGKEEPSRSET